MSGLIQWPSAKYWTKAWNPVIGCHAASPACEHCWARGWTERFGGGFEPRETGTTFRPPQSGVVFCGNLTDMFGGWMGHFGGSDAFVARTLGHPKATYLWLTKRPGEMVDTLMHSSWAVDDEEMTFGWCEMGNQYFGFTAENQEWYDRRFKEFRKLATKWKGWLSAEPLLGPIDLGLRNVYPPEAMPFQWVVVGCESGWRRRPCKLEWVEDIVAECMSANVPVFVKQLDLNGRCEANINKFPAHLRVRQVPWDRRAVRAVRGWRTAE